MMHSMDQEKEVFEMKATINELTLYVKELKESNEELQHLITQLNLSNEDLRTSNDDLKSKLSILQQQLQEQLQQQHQLQQQLSNQTESSDLDATATTSQQQQQQQQDTHLSSQQQKEEKHVPTANNLQGSECPQTPLTMYAANMNKNNQNNNNNNNSKTTTGGGGAVAVTISREDELIEHVTYLRQAFTRFVKARDTVEMQATYYLLFYDLLFYDSLFIIYYFMIYYFNINTIIINYNLHKFILFYLFFFITTQHLGRVICAILTLPEPVIIYNNLIV
jgi:hypothetical protein